MLARALALHAEVCSCACAHEWHDFLFPDRGCLLASYAEDLHVDDGDDDERRVEGGGGRDDGVDGVHLQAARGRHLVAQTAVVVGREPAEVDGQEGDGRTTRPDGGDEEIGATGRQQCLVAEWPCYGHIAMRGDGAQVQDGRRAAHDVTRRPEVAERAAEVPPTRDAVDHGEWHDE